MNITVEELSSIKKKLSIEVAADVVGAELEKAYQNVAKTANIKGFRKGKVPRALLEKHYGPRVESEVIGSLVNNSIYKAMIEHKVEPVSQPEIVEAGNVEKGQPFCYQAEVEVRPEIEAKDYLGLELEKEKVDVKDEVVDQRLAQMVESRMELEVTKRKKAREGDTVIIDFEGFIDGSPFENGTAEDYQLELGSGSFIPGFEEQLIGLKREEEKEVEVSFPENYGAKQLAGKPATFKVLLKEIKEKVEPKLNNEFAKDFGAESMDDLKARIKEDAVKQEENRVKTQLQEKLIEALIAKNPLEVPDGMVKNQLLYLKDNFSSRLKAQGMSLEMLGMNEERFNATYYDMAQQQVKGELIIDSIAKLEGIEISGEELEEKIKGIAEETGSPLENVQKYFENASARDGLKTQLQRDKVVDLLLEKAKVVEVEIKPEDKAEETSKEEG